MQMLLLTAESHSIEVDVAISTPAAVFWITTVSCMLGLSILIVWQFWFGGFGSLKDAPVRRNRMFEFVPVLVLLAWLFSESMINYIIGVFFKDSTDSFLESITYPPMAVLRIALIVLMLFIAHRTFARRLKGLGLNIKTVGRDVSFAVVYLIAICPLILFCQLSVLMIGHLVMDDFNMQTHQSLTFLAENTNLALRVLTILFAAVIVPVFEEMLFRGFMQSALRSVSVTPWTVIIFTSTFFALMHIPNYTHMPALFVLSCGLGYAYERSGSLLRPILMHIFFNGFNIAATLWSAY